LGDYDVKENIVGSGRGGSEVRRPLLEKRVYRQSGIRNGYQNETMRGHDHQGISQHSLLKDEQNLKEISLSCNDGYTTRKLPENLPPELKLD